MNRVAQAAELAKGTLYLYFKTKEELFLTIYSEMFEQFFNNLNEELDKLEYSSPEEMANLTAAFMVERPLLLRLMAISHSVLEKNTKAEAIIEFKRMTLMNVARTGENLERLLPFLKNGEGGHLVLSINALILGAHQLTNPSPDVRQILADHPDLRPFNLDAETFLNHLVLTHLEGVKRRNQQS